MRVLVVVSQLYRIGGAERLQVDLACALNARGIRADVVSAYRDDFAGASEMRAELERRGIPSLTFLGLQPHPSVGQLLSAIWRLRRLLRAGRYDAIEASGTTPALVTLLASIGTPTAPIIGIHQVFERHRDRSMSERLMRIFAGMDRRARFYAVSKSAAHGWTDFTGVPAKRIRVVYNSVADSFFAPPSDRGVVRRELGVPESDRIILFCGRLARYKGIRTAFDAVLPVLESERLVLAYLGAEDADVPGSRDDIAAIRAIAAERNLERRVLWLGHRTDVARIVSSADVLVHPTRKDSFGLSLAEALAAGTPIVASDVEGIPEVLSGTDSQMLAPDDIGGFRRAILATLGRSPSERERTRALGRERANAFRESRRIDEMVALLKDLAAGRF